jgi:flagellar biosynthesis activator protein FlaF
MDYASNAYAKIAKETARPRDLEATLLLKAAAKLQAVRDDCRDKPSALTEALTYNRKLWTVYIDAVTRDGNRLPLLVRENIVNLGLFVMAETFSLMTKLAADHLTSLIKINCRVAAGLRDRD